MTLKDVLSYEPTDISRLMKNKKELRQAIRVAAKAANSRLVRLEKLEKQTGYKASYLETHPELKRFKYGVGDNANKMIAQLQLLRGFLDAKTSTVTGEKTYREKMKKLLPESVYENKTIWNSVWKVYHKAEESVKARLYSFYRDSGKEKAVRTLNNITSNLLESGYSEDEARQYLEKFLMNYSELKKRKEYEELLNGRG